MDRNEPPAPAAANAPPLGAYRLVSKDSAKARWLKDVRGQAGGFDSAGVFEAWANATWATDPESSKQNPPMLRAPNGVAEDSMNYWSAGRRCTIRQDYRANPAASRRMGRGPSELPRARLFAQLKNTPYKRLIELSEGTHTVMMERTACNSSAS